jgi:sortase (surface protein transpeptidase)
MYGRPMKTTNRRPRLARRVLVLLGLAGILAGVVAEPASAYSVRRTWTAHLGSGGANGTAILRGYMAGDGSLELNLVGLQPSTTYPIIVYRGSCAAPLLITRLPGAVTDATGAVAKTSALSIRIMNAVWSYGRTGAIAIKVGTGALARCAALTYPVATRIAIPALNIDLPIVRGPSGYPYCNVAMYYSLLSQPREGGVSLIFGHARVGMFLPLLDRSKINNGASLIGMTIQVWTSNDLLSTYKIVRVRRHVTSLDGVFAVSTEQLWVQTSEGPHGTTEKLIVVATRISSVPSTHAAAHPTPHPKVCGY